MARNFDCSLWARNSVPMPGLLKVQTGLLRATFERQLDVPGECFRGKTGRLSALHNGACQPAYGTVLQNLNGPLAFGIFSSHNLASMVARASHWCTEQVAAYPQATS